MVTIKGLKRLPVISIDQELYVAKSNIKFDIRCFCHSAIHGKKFEEVKKKHVSKYLNFENKLIWISTG
jgi:hypothetical protein